MKLSKSDPQLARSAKSDQPPPPVHVAIIMDGNGRWAKARALPRTEGHRQGIEAAAKKGDRQAEKEMTVFARRLEKKLGKV